jgi:Met-zincin/Domain of unknown function (DUF5117)
MAMSMLVRFAMHCAPPLLLCAALSAPASAQAPAASAPQASPLDGAEPIGGSGRFAALRKGGSTLLVLPPDALRRPLLWYTEAISVPAGVVTNNGVGIVDSMVRFERVGGVVHVRDLSTVQKRRAAPRPTDREPGSVPGSAPNDPKRRPIELAVSAGQTGALIASFPIVATRADGSLVVDVTATFSSDIPAATGRTIAVGSGIVPLAVDPTKSYIERVRIRGDAVNIRTHLTFLGTVAAAPILGPQPVSLVLGHSIVFLPEKPMASRRGDPRVGYFPIEYTEFESGSGNAQDRQTLISRFRLEKQDPSAAVSDPVKPITYYLGRGIPQRWRPYIAAAVLQWLPAFEAAGFSNALRVQDAPTPEQDPDWSEEDVTINVIRWLPQEHVNAMGPHVSDPRSGETLSAHIQVWAQVIDGFGQYYFAMFGGGVDPTATKLPLSTEKSGQLLTYIVAHEVGHTLGLLHNQIASTAYSVAQMRDAGFANRNGPNSSVMAYGRFNQAAQPGDGVTQLWSVLGPYDYAAIKYGYGVFGTDAASERKALAEFADTFSRDRRLYFGSEELSELVSRFGRDPRVQTENTGAERVAATRLGVGNILRSLQRLDAATGGDDKLYADTYGTILARHVGLLESVQRMVGGVMPAPAGAASRRTEFVPASEQREAVRYLLGDGAASLEPYAAPGVVERVSPFGGERVIDRLQSGIVTALLSGSNVTELESQRRGAGGGYSSADLGRDVTTTLWADLARPTPTQRALQRGYLAAVSKLLDGWSKGGADDDAQARKLEAGGLPALVARSRAESGYDTVFIAWLRAELPRLKARIDRAAGSTRDESARLHLGEMSAELARLMRRAAS